jgi:hypothetical protein
MFSPHSPLAEGLNVLPTLAASSTAQALAQLSREQHPAQPLPPTRFIKTTKRVEYFTIRRHQAFPCIVLLQTINFSPIKSQVFQSIFRP